MKLSCDSEVHLVSEVSPDGEVANLTSLLRRKNFTLNECSKLHKQSEPLTEPKKEKNNEKVQNNRCENGEV